MKACNIKLSLIEDSFVKLRGEVGQNLCADDDVESRQPKARQTHFFGWEANKRTTGAEVGEVQPKRQQNNTNQNKTKQTQNKTKQKPAKQQAENGS